MVFDCGHGATLLIYNPDSSAQSFTMTTDIVSTSFSLIGLDSWQIPCVGEVELTSSYPDYKFLMLPSANGAFTDILLLGLAGLLCGALIAWVINKYGL